MRPKHYIKNALILVPLIFGSQLLDASKLTQAIVAIVIFCILSSAVYIINDLKDIANDRKHPEKKFRPLASGQVSVKQAIILATVLLASAIILACIAQLSIMSWLLLIGYLIINIGYSFGLKNVPIIDIALLASGFIIRILYGASVVDISVSHWLYLTVLAGAFYASLGKRRNEIIVNGTKSRKVNKHYTLQFLDKNMYVCLTLTLVFYSLWATDPLRSGSLFYITIPLVILLLMAYSMEIEKNDSTGDPVDVLLKSKILRVLVLLYAILTLVIVYL